MSASEAQKRAAARNSETWQLLAGTLAIGAPKHTIV